MSRIISIARALSLRTLLFALVGAMGAMLTVTLALNATSSWRAGTLAAQTTQSNATADLLLSAAAHWAAERGITNGVLSAEPPLGADVRSQIAEHRKKADAALAEAAARLDDDKSPAVQALLREAEAMLRDIDQLRGRVDAEVSRARSQRDVALRAAWFPAMTRLIEVSQRLRLAAEINLESMETRLQTLQQLKHLAWVMAEYAGRERGMLNGTIQAGAPLRGEQLVALGIARGNVEFAWEIVQAITSKPGAAPALVAATQTVRDTMFGRFQQDRDAVYKAGLAGEPYPLSAQDWFNHSTEAIGTVLRLGEATTEATRQFASEMEARSQLNLTIDLMVLAAAVLLTGIAAWSASARITRPLQEMAIAMGRLAHGETTISVPAQGRNDEIGEMAKAVEVFRQNAIRIRELEAEKMADQARKEARALEALTASEASLNEAQRISHTGSWRWNVGTGEVFSSAELLRIFDFDPAAQPSYAMFMERVHPDDRLSLEQMLDSAVCERRRFQHEYRIVLPDGSLKHLQAVGQGGVAQPGDIEFVVTVMDVTDRIRAEQALREAQMELARVARLTTMGQLTASIAHEVNHPIAATSLNAQTALRWLNRDPPSLEEAREQLARIVNDGRRAANVVSRINDLVKKAPLRMEALHVNEAISEVIELTRGEATKNRISVRAQFARSLPAARADRTQVQQVILNLILNAVQAMSDGDQALRELSIVTSADRSDHVFVSVRDSGPGIHPDNLNHLFDPFYTTKLGGMGMGLSICRSIIEGHGGQIWATSGGQRGAAFNFTLPTVPQ